jgi:hypothetical protein
MTPTPTQVREQIRFLVECAVKGDNIDVVVNEILQAAWLDLHTECEKCEGRGDIRVGLVIYDDGDVEVKDCPACAGRGYTPNPERLEAAVQAIVDEPGFEWQGLDDPDIERHLRDTARDAAHAAILAYLGEHETTQGAR